MAENLLLREEIRELRMRVQQLQTAMAATPRGSVVSTASTLSDVSAGMFVNEYILNWMYACLIVFR